MIAASSKLDLHKQMDNDLFNHIVYVANQIAMVAKKEGATWPTLEKSGKMLWRLYNVVQAYEAKNRDLTLNQVLSMVKEVKDVFGIAT